MAVRRAAIAAFLALSSGCAVMDDVIGRPPEVIAAVDAFNRTEADIFYIAADGERLDVPACGNASDQTFRIDDVRVRTEDGYIRGFGVSAPEFSGQHVFVVEVSHAADSGIPTLGPPPQPLPPCEGLPEVQPGI
jgi:hypothetical protein